MKNEIKELMSKDKTNLTASEMMLALKLCQIKKNENTRWENVALLASPVVVILCIVNLFTPVFVDTFSMVLNYICTIPACLNIAIKIREYTIKRKFMKEFEISRNEMKEILNSDQMKLFAEIIKEFNDDTVEIIKFKQKDDTFPDFAFTEEEVGINLEHAQNKIYTQEPKKRNLIRKIVKKKKTASANKGGEELVNENTENNDDKNLNM